jgi:hypothetical protein
MYSSEMSVAIVSKGRMINGKLFALINDLMSNCLSR